MVKCTNFTYVDDLVNGIRLLVDCVPNNNKKISDMIAHHLLHPIGC